MEMQIKKKYLIIASILFVSVLLLTVIFILRSLNNPDNTLILQTPIDNCTPAFADGGGPYYKPGQPFRDKIAPPDTSGQKLIVSGRVVSKDCITLVPNAIIDIWQADNTGEYRDDWYRGQIKTDSSGNYYFETVLPKGYGEGTGYRPPHIHFKIIRDNKLVITSQMFFSDVQGRTGFDDAYIIETQEENGTLYGKYDIVLP